MQRKLGLIAGTGILPNLIINECKSRNREVVVLSFEGENRNTTITHEPSFIQPIGAIGKSIKILKENKCNEVVLAGGFKRPSFKSITGLDWTGAKLISKIARSKGDDDSLSEVIKEIEKAGLKVIGLDEILPSSIIQPGLKGKISTTKDNDKDIELGINLLKNISEYDIGQSVVVDSGRIVGIEGHEGTELLIKRCSVHKSNLNQPILIKSTKVGQERRVDLPAVGEDTINQLYQAGFIGLAIEAGSSIVLNKKRVISLANKFNIFFLGFRN
ncbi:UDP-2,3-diacylglucosamine diphosphatase LpxI [Alphaproteobacteria bacterium]|nr:UDP-2,3-diacylglucosamine diphosphatase LpxI [Alphaproteobacteria bacterium]